MLEELKRLCTICGTSGDEGRVREYIISRIKDHCEYSVDPLGSIIAFKKGKNTPKNKIMLDAHMDEVGLIVTYIQSDGTLTADMVGGVDPSVVIGRQVLVGDKLIPGVAGSQAVHKLTKAQREKKPQMKDIYIDIGAENKEEAEKHIKVGDLVYFKDDISRLGNKLCSKAIDDRFGCALLIKLIREDIPYDAYFTFTVQEEIGLRGAKAAAYSVAPDVAIVCETTTASDIEGVSGGDTVCRLGEGAVVSFMDRSTMYDRELYNIAFDLAEKNNIKCQTKTRIAGGNNSGAVHISGKGVRTAAVSLPCRYLHSPSCVADIDDMESCYKLVRLLMEKAAVI